MVLKQRTNVLVWDFVWEWCKNVWYSNILVNLLNPWIVWEWCKNVWYSNKGQMCLFGILFENDVKMYGTQTICLTLICKIAFENDVKMYGTQTNTYVGYASGKFENDVKMYGTQTKM